MIDEWTRKVWYIYSMKYYSAIKKEIMPFAAAGMDLQTVTLNELFF